MNSLWSLSLVISLICALLAISLQQWARQYIRVTQPTQCSPEKRARSRAFFAGGVDKMHLHWAVEALPFLIHLSLFLFLSGFIIYMRNINHSVYLSTILATGLFSAVYIFLTFMPLFRPDSPYNTPLSPIAHAITRFVIWALVVCFIYLSAFIILYPLAILAVCFIALIPLFVIIRRVCGACLSRSLSELKYFAAALPEEEIERFGKRGLNYMIHPFNSSWNWARDYSQVSAEERISKTPPAIDLGILKWTIGALGDDDTLEKFFEHIPGFFHSRAVRDLERPLPDAFLSRFSDAWGGFLARNLLSNSVDDAVKTHRLDVCMKAIKGICDDDGPSEIFWRLSSLRFDQVPPSIHTAEILEPWCKDNDSDISELARYTAAKVLPYVRERDDRWITFAQDVFGLPEGILRGHIARGDDSVMLAILICAARQVISTEPCKWEMLPSISKFDILDTLPGLQNEFCSLWNEIVEEGWDMDDPVEILRGIRHLYIALHQGTDCAPTLFDGSTPDDDLRLRVESSYPRCTIHTHDSDSSVSLLPRLGHTHNLSPPPSPSAPLHSQELSSPSPNTVPEHIAPEANPATLSSIHESIETVTLDTNRLVVTEVSYSSYQSSPPAASLTTNIVRSHNATNDLPTNEMDRTSRTPTATFHTLPQPDAVPVIVTPLTVSCAPGDFFDTFFYLLPRHLRLLVLQTTVMSREA